MSSLADAPDLVGFFSYSREDDEDSGGKLSKLRERIQKELRGQLGRTRRDFRLWQDKTAIAHGKLWEDEIKSAITESVFFVPIITPTAVRSPHCKFEFDAFLAREKELGRNDLIFPILYILVSALTDDRWRDDPLLAIIGSRQYEDWQTLRHFDASSSTTVGRRVEKLCVSICSALQQPWLSLKERQQAEARQRDNEERRRQEAEHKRRLDPHAQAHRRGMSDPGTLLDAQGDVATRSDRPAGTLPKSSQGVAQPMPSGRGERYDFFLSRRGSVATIAREVTEVLLEKGYSVFVQDYDIPLTANFIEEMHEAIKNARDLVVLFTRDYAQSPYTRMEFASFEANAAQSAEHRRMVILRCEDVPLLGLFAPHVYQDLVGIGDAEERRSRILAALEGRSPALEPPPRPFIGVPPRIASFTGRAEQLDQLDAILMRDKPAAVTRASVGRVALHGMGGVGKTALAVEYAHRFRGLYAGVCWCPAETRTGLLSALASLAVTLGAATGEEADVEKAARAAVRRLAEQRATWLLVYDNVTAPDEIADLLPSAGARVLITSRFSDWSKLADEVALDVLPPEQAVALLESRTGRSDAAGARTLAGALGNLPLALDHAAAYCKRARMSFADYAAKASSLSADASRDVDYPRSIAATFNLAITEAVAQCQAAETLMAYLAQCAPERIPMTLVEGAVEEKAERLQALAALAEVSLLKHDPFEDGTPAVTVNRLVQVVARARSEANGSAEHAVRRLFARLVVTYPKEVYRDPQSWPLCAKLTPHLLALRDICPDATSDFADWVELLTDAGGYLLGRAAYSQAAPLLRDALAIREKVLGPEHPETATSLGNLASLLHAQGDLAGARSLYKRALAIREKVLGPEHPDRANSLGNLANLLRDQGDLAGARPLLERALAIREKARGPEHPDTATSLDNLALLLSDQGDFSGARPLLERALAIRLIRRRPSTTSPYCSGPRAIFRGHFRFSSARWR
jgi:tetratricopeptide (TPR) repeat protein